jgi:hypothetical protein
VRKPLCCEFCFDTKYPVSWSNRLAAWTCLLCHLTESEPMPIFNDSQPPVYCVKEGDYIICVTGYEQKYSKGEKTRGSEQAVLEIEIEGTGCVFQETMTFHQNTMWRIDQMLKCCGVAPELGRGWSFQRSEAEAHPGWAWINPIGLRGHAGIIVAPYESKTQKDASGKPKMIDANKVGVFYTDRPKLPPREITGEEDEDCPF